MCWQNKNLYNFIVLVVLEGKCILRIWRICLEQKSKKTLKLNTAPPCARLSSFFSVFLHLLFIWYTAIWALPLIWTNISLLLVWILFWYSSLGVHCWSGTICLGTCIMTLKIIDNDYLLPDPKQFKGKYFTIIHH